MPMAVRVAPGMECARKPIALTSFTTASTSPAVALGFITINIVSIRVRLFSSRRHEISLGKKREKSAPVEGTVAFYRQTPSADVETNCKPSAASIQEDMSALIARNHTANRKLVDSNFV